MAFFGLFGDDEEEQKPSSGGILSAIWTAIKWAAVIAIAVLTLGAIFAFSDKARDFADKYTGSEKPGDGKGAGTWLAEIFGKGKKAVEDLTHHNPTPEEVSREQTVKTQAGEVKVKTFNDEIKQDAAVSDLSRNPALYDKLKDIKAAREELSLAISDEDKKAGGEITVKRKKAIAFAQKVEAWNEAVDVTAKANEGTTTPVPPKIKLAIPTLPPMLMAFGKNEFDKFEMQKPARQIELLESRLSSLETPELKPAFQISSNNVPLPSANITNIDQVIGGTSWAGTAPGRALGADKGAEEHLQSVISELIKKERFSEATLVADQSAKRFGELASEYKAEHNNKEIYKPYSEARDRFKKISEYTGFLDKRNALDGVTDQAYTSIIAAAKDTPLIVKNYEAQIEAFSKANAPTSITTPTDEKANATKLRELAAQANRPAAAASGVTNGLENVDKGATIAPANAAAAASASASASLPAR